MFLALPADVFDSRQWRPSADWAAPARDHDPALDLSDRPVSDRLSFQPIIIAASIVPCIATVIFLTMVARSQAPGAG